MCVWFFRVCILVNVIRDGRFFRDNVEVIRECRFIQFHCIYFIIFNPKTSKLANQTKRRILRKFRLYRFLFIPYEKWRRHAKIIPSQSFKITNIVVFSIDSLSNSCRCKLGEERLVSNSLTVYHGSTHFIKETDVRVGESKRRRNRRKKSSTQPLLLSWIVCVPRLLGSLDGIIP